MTDAAAPAVLVVDDDADIRDVLTTVLASGGLRVAVAADGDEALARARTTPGLAVILLDLMLPRVSGADVLRALKADPALNTLPVIVVSGDRTAAKTAASLGATAFLAKPVELDDLLLEVGRIVGSRRGQA